MPCRETDLVYAIVALLELNGIPAWRQNTGGRHWTRKDGSEAYVPFGIPGQSDILGIIPPIGRFLAIEVKKPGNKPTTEQWAYMLGIQKAGGVALWVDCIEAVAHIIPHLINGCVVTVDKDHQQTITDESRTLDSIQPPTPKGKAHDRPTRRTPPQDR